MTDARPPLLQPPLGLADALDTASVPQKTEISSVLRELARHQP